MVIDSALTRAELLEILTRAAAYGDIRRVPDPLRAEDVDTLTFSVLGDNRFRIVPNGLRNPVHKPRVRIDGRGEILPGRNQFPTCIQFQVGLDKSSVIGVITTFALVLGLIIYNFVRDPTFGSAFWSLIGLGVVFAAVFYFQERSLVERAWPGLLIEAKRVADGSLYVPAA
jgi:hypothetical protein